MLVPVAVNLALRRNRSADRGDLTVPRAKNTSYSDRSFAIAAPMLWNSFPVELHCSSSMKFVFKRKTYFHASDPFLGLQCFINDNVHAINFSNNNNKKNNIYLGQRITSSCRPLTDLDFIM